MLATKKRKPEMQSWECMVDHNRHACEPQRACSDTETTETGRDLRNKVRVVQLEREVARLRKVVETFLGMVGAYENKAYRRLQEKTPDHAILKLWVENSNPPADLAAEPEERPW